MRTLPKEKAERSISKAKLKEVLSISDVARKYSPKIKENVRRPLIICPFHEDHNLGSCWIYPDTNTFKCQACGAHGDMIKLASGYLKIDLQYMDDLFEKLVSDFGILHSSVEDDYNGKPVKAKIPERLSPEEYKELLFDDHYTVPIKFQQMEYEKDEWDYVPCEYQNIYYRTLAVSDPEFHDWVICTVSRKYWFRYAQMLLTCQTNGYALFEDVIQNQMDRSIELLKKGLVNKKHFREELRLRNSLYEETVCNTKLSA